MRIVKNLLLVATLGVILPAVAMGASRHYDSIGFEEAYSIALIASVQTDTEFSPTDLGSFMNIDDHIDRIDNIIESGAAVGYRVLGPKGEAKAGNGDFSSTVPIALVAASFDTTTVDSSDASLADIVYEIEAADFSSLGEQERAHAAIYYASAIDSITKERKAAGLPYDENQLSGLDKATRTILTVLRSIVLVLPQINPGKKG